MYRSEWQANETLAQRAHVAAREQQNADALLALLQQDAPELLARIIADRRASVVR